MGVKKEASTTLNRIMNVWDFFQCEIPCFPGVKLRFSRTNRKKGILISCIWFFFRSLAKRSGCVCALVHGTICRYQGKTARRINSQQIVNLLLLLSFACCYCHRCYNINFFTIVAYLFHSDFHTRQLFLPRYIASHIHTHKSMRDRRIDSPLEFWGELLQNK